MKYLYKALLTVLLSLSALAASAHVQWGTVDGVDCGGTKCKLDAVHLVSGEKIEVSYNVTIQHTATIAILFINDGEEIVLVDGLPEPKGLTTVEVTLPDVECEGCKLRVEAAGYSGTATINLSKTGWVAEDDVVEDGIVEDSSGTQETKKKSGGSMDWQTVLFGLVCGMYCLTICVQGVRKERASLS